MAKIIRLPSGLEIDMEQGEIRTPMGSGPVPINRNTRVHAAPRSAWERFDDFIEGIGNWIASHSERITSTIAIILVIIGAISFIISLFSLGLFWGIVVGILLSGVAYYALMVIVGIFTWISNIFLGLIRYIFYSGTTFLIALAIAAAVIGINVYASLSNDDTASAKTEYISSAPITTKYICTARTYLNVRSEPDISSRVIGSIRSNEVVEVYNIVNGFAKVKSSSGFGYASLKYLRQLVD